jgi:hypothetical protein
LCDLSRFASEARGKARNEGFRRPNPITHFNVGLSDSKRHGEGYGHRILSKTRTPWGVIVTNNIRPDLRASLVTFGPALSADYCGNLRGNDVAIGMNRNEQGASFKREPNATSRRGGARCAAKPQRFSLKFQQFFGVNLAAHFFDRTEQLALKRRQLIHLRCKGFGVGQDFPGRLKSQRKWRGRRAP